MLKITVVIDEKDKNNINIDVKIPTKLDKASVMEQTIGKMIVETLNEKFDKKEGE